MVTCCSWPVCFQCPVEIATQIYSLFIQKIVSSPEGCVACTHNWAGKGNTLVLQGGQNDHFLTLGLEMVKLNFSGWFKTFCNFRGCQAKGQMNLDFLFERIL